MNKKVAVRKCSEYDLNEVYNHISDIYKACDGPDFSNKKVLIKPNILTDSDPALCVCTHPVVVEAMIIFLQSRGAIVFVGDSPAIQTRSFRGEKSGIYSVCLRRGAFWTDFTKNPVEIASGKGKIKIASIVREVDLIISLPKFKNHELVYMTGAIKNTLGLVPGLLKAKQHAVHQGRKRFSEFLVDLSEAVTPDFFLMDGIVGMEGPGPGQGYPVKTGLLLGSTNPVALDIIAGTVAGYDPMDIPTNAVAVSRGLWLKDAGEIIYDGPKLRSIVKNDFKRIAITGDINISLKFLKNRLYFLKKFERRPVFKHKHCISCLECIKICPANAIKMHQTKKNHVILNDKKCIRCFCCSEVCQSNAIDIRLKIFGA